MKERLQDNIYNLYAFIRQTGAAQLIKLAYIYRALCAQHSSNYFMYSNSFVPKSKYTN